MKYKAYCYTNYYNTMHLIWHYYSLNIYKTHTHMSAKKKSKTAVMSLRVDPTLKAAAETAALKDRRSLTSFIEVLIARHCESVGIELDSIDSEGG